MSQKCAIGIPIRLGARTAASVGRASAILLLLLAATCHAGEAQSYAVVIGISNYHDSHWAHLPNGRPDAEQMATVLRRQGFQVRPFLDQNATVAGIDAYVEDDLAPRLQSDDRVLFFFSGHGQTRTVGSQEFGYVVPYEATKAASTWISMDKIKEYSRVLNSARHQLFILDSCFSGSLISRGVKLEPDIPDYPAYIEALKRRVARTVITAGGKDQQVADSGYQHMSLFTYELVQALQDGLADVRHEGFITVSDIFSFVLHAASTGDQTPSLGTLPGDQGGEMVFTSPRASYLAKVDAPARSVGVGTTREAQSISAPVSSSRGRPVSSDARELTVTILGSCGHDEFGAEAVKRSILSELGNYRMPGSLVIKIIGGTESDPYEGSGTDVKVYARYTICHEGGTGSCPDPPPDCHASCRISAAGSLSANRELAKEHLAEEISNRAKSTEFERLQTVEGSLCGS